MKRHPLTYATNLPGVYAAGDIVRGASLVVWAIKRRPRRGRRDPHSSKTAPMRRA
jgi:NADPH-dependent glutamate synthase beta subunit-like oxidoreductase